MGMNCAMTVGEKHHDRLLEQIMAFVELRGHQGRVDQAGTQKYKDSVMCLANVKLKPLNALCPEQYGQEYQKLRKQSNFHSRLKRDVLVKAKI